MSSPDLITSFLTYYVRSLGERSRVEESGTKYGFEWIIYNLALAENFVPVRLPFLRVGGDAMSKTKTEGEFGVDLEFLSADGRELRIFVLKDEVLNNKNWTKHDFDADLRRAVAPELTGKGLEKVRTVRVILAYNKDEDANGITLFNNLVGSFGTKLGNKATLVVDRWNLTGIVERVKAGLLNPSLLPQRFFSLFTYISAQVTDIVHDSESWRQHVVPAWKRFLDDLLAGAPSERAVRLVPVALLILAQHGERNPSFATGHLDLTEWAMLKLWSVQAKASGTKNKPVREAIARIWDELYVTDLAKFYSRHKRTLLTENGLSVCGAAVNYLGALGAAYIAFWHIGRLGILAMALPELTPADEPTKVPAQPAVDPAATTAGTRMSTRSAIALLIDLINRNPAALRPILDSHHVELFLLWNALRQLGRPDDIFAWLQALEQRLRIRRAGKLPLPFLEGYSLLERVFEQAVTGKKPADFMDKSSYLLTMLLELCFSLEPEAARHEMVGRIMRHLVLNLDNGVPPSHAEPLTLVGWRPPADWSPRVLEERVTGGIGIALQLTNSLEPREQAASVTSSAVRSRQALALSEGIPASAHVLACLKFSSPLPPEFWRQRRFSRVGP